MLQFPYEIIEKVNKFNVNEFEWLLQDQHSLAFLLYYSKWLSRPFQEVLLTFALKRYKLFNKQFLYWIPFSLSLYPKRMQHLIMQNIGFLQTNFWCTKWCFFCGCDAIYSKNPISIPFPQIKYLFKNYSKEITKNYTYLYWASDPLDYRFRNKTYKHVLKLYQKYIKKRPYTSSAIRKDNFWLYKQIAKKVTRVSYLWSDKQIYEKIKHQINDDSYEGFSLKNIRYNGLWGYKNQKYDNGILCLNGTLLTPFCAYNLVNIGRCNNFFPQWLLSYPVLTLSNDQIKPGDNLIDFLTKKIVMYDYVDLRVQRGKFDKFVVFLRDYSNIYFLICTKSEIENWIIRVLNVVNISFNKYLDFCFSKVGQNILLKLETNG